MGAKLSHEGPLIYPDSIEKSLLLARMEPLLQECVKFPHQLPKVCMKELKPALTTGPDRMLAAQILVDSIKWKMKQVDVPIKDKYYYLHVLRICMEFNSMFLAEYAAKKLSKRFKTFCIFQKSTPEERALALGQFSSSPDPEYSEKVFGLILELVQYWGTGKPLLLENVEMPNKFGKVYSELLGQAVKFPQEYTLMKEFPIEQLNLIRSSLVESNVEPVNQSKSHSPNKIGGTERISREMSQDVKQSDLAGLPNNAQEEIVDVFAEMIDKIEQLHQLRVNIQNSVFSDDQIWAQNKKSIVSTLTTQIKYMSELRKEINGHPKAISMLQQQNPKLKETVLKGKQEMNIGKEISRGWNIFGLDEDLNKFRQRIKEIIEKETLEKVDWNTPFLRDPEDPRMSTKVVSLTNFADTTPRFKPLGQSNGFGSAPQQLLKLPSEEFLPDSPETQKRPAPIRRDLTFQEKTVDEPSKQDLSLEIGSPSEAIELKPDLTPPMIEKPYSSLTPVPAEPVYKEEPHKNSAFTLCRLPSLTLGPDTAKLDINQSHVSLKGDTSALDSNRIPDHMPRTPDKSTSSILMQVQRDRDRRTRELVSSSKHDPVIQTEPLKPQIRMIKEPSEYVSREDEKVTQSAQFGDPDIPRSPIHPSSSLSHRLRDVWFPPTDWKNEHDPNKLIELLAQTTYHNKLTLDHIQDLQQHVLTLQDRKISLLQKRNQLKQIQIANLRQTQEIPQIKTDLVQLRREVTSKQAELNLQKHRCHGLAQELRELEYLRKPQLSTSDEVSRFSSFTETQNDDHSSFLEGVNKQVDDLLERSFASRGRGDLPIIRD